MMRALFFRELRTALIANTVIVGSIYGIFTLIVWSVAPQGKGEPSLRILGFIISTLISAFFAVEQSVSKNFKGDRFYFLAALPISRLRASLMVTCGRLAAALPILVLIVASIDSQTIAGESRIANLIPAGEIWRLLHTFSLIYLVIFFSASFIALLIRKTVLVYGAAALLLAVFSFAGYITISYTCSPPNHLSVIYGLYEPAEAACAQELMTIGIFLVAASLLLLASRLVVQGASGSRRSRWQSALLGATSLIAIWTAVSGLALQPNLAQIGDTWISVVGQSGEPLSLPAWGVDFEGRHIFVAQRLANRPALSRLTIIDTVTAKTTGRWEGQGAFWARWSEQGFLDLFIDPARPTVNMQGPNPVYPKGGSLSWVRLKVNGSEIAGHDLQGVQDLGVLPDSRILAILKEGDLGRVVLLGGRRAKEDEILRSTLTDGAKVFQTTSGLGIQFESPRKAWILGSRIQEIPGKLWYPDFGNEWIVFGKEFREERLPPFARRIQLSGASPPLLHLHCALLI